MRYKIYNLGIIGFWTELHAFLCMQFCPKFKYKKNQVRCVFILHYDFKVMPDKFLKYFQQKIHLNSGLKVANIIVYTDFDGTVTKRSGSDTVFTEFYQSLLSGYQENIIQDYKNTRMKDSNLVMSLFEAKFGIFDENFNYGQADANLLMSVEAVVFFQEILKNENVAINIVTKNRIDYVRALFKFQRFTEKKINKINITDSGLKYYDVDYNIKSQKNRVSYLYILDDSAADYNEMMSAAQANGYQSDQIHGYNKSPGEFDWSTYQRDIQSL
jgi:2-hydroxy-3-keto-5-methylthiopentenyl-1-phosphate phosphatase